MRLGGKWKEWSLIKGFDKLRKSKIIGKIKEWGIEEREIEILRKRNMVMKRKEERNRKEELKRIGDKIIEREVFVENKVEEGGVREVLKKEEEEIGEKSLMREERWINEGREKEILGEEELIIKRIKNEVKELEIKIKGFEIRKGKMIDSGECMRVMGRKLRKDKISRGKKIEREGNIGKVSMKIEGIERKIIKKIKMRKIDIRIKIGEIKKKKNEEEIGEERKIDDEIKKEGEEIEIGMKKEEDEIKEWKIRVLEKDLKKVERKLKKVGIIRVDIEEDIIGIGDGREWIKIRKKLKNEEINLREGIKRVKRRKIDGNEGKIINEEKWGRKKDGVDRGLIIIIIKIWIGGGGRGIEKNVVGIEEEEILKIIGEFKRIIDGLEGEEMIENNENGNVKEEKDERIEEEGDEEGKRGGKEKIIEGIGEIEGKEKEKCRRIEEKREKEENVGFKVEIRYIVEDKRIESRNIGNEKKGLGKENKRKELMDRKRILMKKKLEEGEIMIGKKRLDKIEGGGKDLMESIIRKGWMIGKRWKELGLGEEIRGSDRLNKWDLIEDRRRKIMEKGKFGKRNIIGNGEMIKKRKRKKM